jgi:hypothetical protein
MSKKFNIKPHNWPKEYTFEEFKRLNPHIINENQLITLYNQYLNKYLTELGEKKIHFKESKVNQLLIELQQLQQQQTSIASPGGGYKPPSEFSTNYSLTFGGADKENYVTTTFDPNDYDIHNGFTVSYWVRPDEISSIKKMALGAEAGQYEFRFGINGATNLYAGTGRWKVDDKVHGMSVGNWYHWVFTYSGHSDGYQWVRAYRNGEAVVVADNGTEGGAYVKHNRTWSGNDVPTMYIGANNDDGTPKQWWACGITDVAIFNEMKDTTPADYLTLSYDVSNSEAGHVPSWVTQTYNSGKPTNLKDESGLVGYWRFKDGTGTTLTDSSGNGNDGTLTYTGDEGTDLPTWSTDVPE